MGQTQFQVAAGLVSGAALVIPQARPLVPLFIAMIANPDDMIRAARDWQDGTAAPKAPGPLVKEAAAEEWHPPMQSDISLLRADLRNLLAAAESKKDWQGSSFEAFKKLVDDFDRELEHLAELRKGVGGSLESAASLYESASTVLVTIAAFVAGLATWTLAMSLLPVSLVATHAQVSAVLFRITPIVIDLCKLIGKLTLKIALILGGIGYSVGAMSAKFPGMQAIKGEAPNFTKAKAIFDQEKISVTKAPDLGMPEMPKGGGLSNLFGGLA